MSENFATSLNAFREAAVNAALYADQGNPGSAATWEAVANDHAASLVARIAELEAALCPDWATAPDRC